MEHSEAEEFLHKSLPCEESRSKETVDEFLSLLTYHPLAITQAIAFIKKNGSSLTEYVKLLKETNHSNIELLRKDFIDPNRASESLNAVQATLLISIRHIEDHDKLATAWLSFLACVAPQNIPRTILPSNMFSKIEQEEAIGTLTGYGFLTERAEKGFYDTHALIHLVSQDWLKSQGVGINMANKVVEHLNELIPPSGHKQSKQYHQYLSHGLFATNISEIADNKATIQLLRKIGLCYQDLGVYSHAIVAHTDVLQRKSRTIGLKQETTLISMNDLGIAWLSLGDYVNAEKIYHQLVVLGKDIYGFEHVSTLTSQTNLASTYRQQGRWKKAEELEVQVLETRKGVLGVEHPDTLNTQGNLALTYCKQGRWNKAEELQAQVLEARKRMLGVEHPNTLMSQGNLALIYREQGRWNEAEELQAQVLEATTRVLGNEHPDALMSQGNLALTYDNQGRWKEAEELQAQVLEARKRMLGVEHPNTPMSQGNLALTCYNQGRWKEAEELQAQVLEARKRVLGAEHPDTICSIHNRAWVLHDQSRLEAAIKLMGQCAALSAKVLGPAHYLTKERQNTLLSWQQSQQVLAKTPDEPVRVSHEGRPSTNREDALEKEETPEVTSESAEHGAGSSAPQRLIKEKFKAVIPRRFRRS